MDGYFKKRKQPTLAGAVLKAGITFLAVCSFTDSSVAQTRRQPDTTTLTCKETQGLIERFGAINLKSGPVKFDRYVSGRNHCIVGQSLRTKFVPTRDGGRCPVQICAESRMNRN